MKNPLVSVLICTYNAGNTIQDTISSCLNQSYTNIEILIHDDQSRDNTIEIIKKIGNSKIKIINSGQKSGPYGGLNFLLDHARGEYIAIQDHDDLWHPEKLQKQINFLESEIGDNYIGCGTKTLMRYESDQKGFEYFLGKENYYTIHPSLVFRNQGQRYPINKGVYMLDAFFQKTVLCKGKKMIYNINKTLTLHLVKDSASNFSYKWFRYSWATIRTVFTLHPVRYGVCIIGFETCRKILYPLLRLLSLGKWVDAIERLPFVILGNTMELYDKERRKEMGYINLF